MNDVIREEERDLLQREVGEWDCLNVDDIIVTVLANEGCRIVSFDLELPYLSLIHI